MDIETYISEGKNSVETKNILCYDTKEEFLWQMSKE